MRPVAQRIKILLKRTGNFEELPTHVGSTRPHQPQPDQQHQQQDGDVHDVPPGVWPQKVPQPSKVAVLLYYISVVFCMIGTIMIVNSFFTTKEEDKALVLKMGSTVAIIGVILSVIMNYMNKKEHDKFVNYVRNKAEEMNGDLNSRQRYNREYAYHISDGPNGVR